MAPSHGFAAASHCEAALRGAPASHGETAFRGAAGFREARRRNAVHPSRNAPLRRRAGRPVRVPARSTAEELGAELHALSVANRWNEMPTRASDEVVRIFAACGTYEEIARAIVAWYGGLADAVEVNFPAGAPAGLQRELVADIRRIPHVFEGFDTRW